MSTVLIIESDTQISNEISDAIMKAGLSIEHAAGRVDALQRLRTRSFSVVITSPESAIAEDLALLEEFRAIRPGIKCIFLADHSTPDDLIAALRAKVFACFTPPFNPRIIASLASGAASDNDWRDDIQVLSARPGWISVRINCRHITAERAMTFAREFGAQWPEVARQEMLPGLREILINAMEHGAGFNAEQVVEVTGVRTKRALVFYLRDPGTGFRRESLSHAAIANPADDPTAHIFRREEAGMRPGGYGLLVASRAFDELIYNDEGNQVLLIKYIDSVAEEVA
jgi:DNA-binding NarL/FixJ family response regulator